MIVKMVLVPGLNPGRYMIIYLLHIETLSLSIIHLRLEPGIASNVICCILVFLDSLANHLQMGYIHMMITSEHCGKCYQCCNWLFCTNLYYGRNFSREINFRQNICDFELLTLAPASTYHFIKIVWIEKRWLGGDISVTLHKQTCD